MINLNRVVDWFEQLTPQSLPEIEQLYHERCYFKDPFNEFYRREQLQLVFAHMFTTLQQPRFAVTETVSQDASAFIVWQFHFCYRHKPYLINGSSHLKFDADGLVNYHRDYWDAAEELYEKLPVLGLVLKQLKKLGR
jgi:hypothetical protein